MGLHIRAKMANYDLSYEVGQFLDNHLVLPILEFLDEKKVYMDAKDPTKASSELLEGKYELLKRTNMTDYALEIFKNLHPGEASPADMVARRDEILKEIPAAKERCSAMLDLLQDQAVVKQLRMENCSTPVTSKTHTKSNQNKSRLCTLTERFSSNVVSTQMRQLCLLTTGCWGKTKLAD